MLAQKCPTKTCLIWRKDLSALQFYWGLFNLHHLDVNSDGLDQVCSDLGLENNCVPWTFLYQNFFLPVLCVHVSLFPLAGTWRALNPCAHSCELCPG